MFFTKADSGTDPGRDHLVSGLGGGVFSYSSLNTKWSKRDRTLTDGVKGPSLLAWTGGETTADASLTRRKSSGDAFTGSTSLPFATGTGLAVSGRGEVEAVA